MKVFDTQAEMLMSFKDSPEGMPEGIEGTEHENRIMHASFKIGDYTLMISDSHLLGGVTEFKGFSLSLTLENEEQVRSIFERLGEGGRVTMPLDKTFWSPLFGAVEDRFGMEWMLSLPSPAHDK